MAVKRKKIGAAGRFGVGYGKPKEKLIAVERKQRVRQLCPFCESMTVKRVEKGVWTCSKCNKKFAGGAFYLKV